MHLLDEDADEVAQLLDDGGNANEWEISCTCWMKMQMKMHNFSAHLLEEDADGDAQLLRTLAGGGCRWRCTIASHTCWLRMHLEMNRKFPALAA